jgi:hypothetical protein
MTLHDDTTVLLSLAIDMALFHFVLKSGEQVAIDALPVA